MFAQDQGLYALRLSFYCVAGADRHKETGGDPCLRRRVSSSLASRSPRFLVEAGGSARAFSVLNTWRAPL